MNLALVSDKIKVFVIPAPIYVRYIQYVMLPCYKIKRKIIITLNAAHLLY